MPAPSPIGNNEIPRRALNFPIHETAGYSVATYDYSTTVLNESSKEICMARVAADANVAIDGSVTVVNGVTLVEGDIVFLPAQTDAAARGPYKVPASGAWGRVSSDVSTWRFVHVREGDFAGRLYELVTDGTITLGTTALTFALVKADVPDGAVTAAKIGDDAVSFEKISPEISPAIHVRVACKTAVALDGSTFSFDGVTINDGEYFLAVAQPPAVGATHAAANGVYRRSGSSIVRVTSDASKMRLIHVMEGTFRGCLFALQTSGAIAVGTTALRFSRIDGAWHNLTYATSDLNATIPNDLGRVKVRVTSTNPTSAKTLTLPRATDYEGTEVWVIWEGGLGVGGSFTVAAQTGEVIFSNAWASSGSRSIGIFIATGGDWFMM